MAEALLRKMAPGDLEVKSAGLVAMDGQDAYPHVGTVLQKRGISINHRSQRVTPELLSWADIILTMTQGHKAALIQQHPDYFDKVLTLKESVQDEEVRDKWQQAVADYEMKRVFYEKALKDQEPEAVIKEREYDLQVARDHVQALAGQEANLDIEDPYGASEAIYEEVCQEIEENLQQFLQKYV
jgi:protein arginine phosphatase